MTMPPGAYYVGDLCYVMNDDDWSEICDITIDGNNCIDGEFMMKDNRRFAMYRTLWGDGTYFDQYGNQYFVDSGTIGCIFLTDTTRISDTADKFSKVFVFKQPFETKSVDGRIYIGHIVIDTDPQDDE